MIWSDMSYNQLTKSTSERLEVEPEYTGTYNFEEEEDTAHEFNKSGLFV